jgi:hypothetical protein
MGGNRIKTQIMKKLILVLALAAVCSPLFLSQAQAGQGKQHVGRHHHAHHHHHKHR